MEKWLLVLLFCAGCFAFVSISKTNLSNNTAVQTIPKLEENDVFTLEIATESFYNKKVKYQVDICTKTPTEEIYLRFNFFSEVFKEVVSYGFECQGNICTKKVADSLDGCITEEVYVQFEYNICPSTVYNSYSEFDVSVFAGEAENNELTTTTNPHNLGFVSTAIGVLTQVSSTLYWDECDFVYVVLFYQTNENVSANMVLEFDPEFIQPKGQGCDRNGRCEMNITTEGIGKLGWEVCVAKPFKEYTTTVSFYQDIDCGLFFGPSSTLNIDVKAPLQCVGGDPVVDSVEQVSSNDFLFTFSTSFQDERLLFVSLFSTQKTLRVRKRQGLFQKTITLPDEVVLEGSVDLFLEGSVSNFCSTQQVTL